MIPPESDRAEKARVTCPCPCPCPCTLYHCLVFDRLVLFVQSVLEQVQYKYRVQMHRVYMHIGYNKYRRPITPVNVMNSGSPQ